MAIPHEFTAGRAQELAASKGELQRLKAGGQDVVRRYEARNFTASSTVMGQGWPWMAMVIINQWNSSSNGVS